MLQIEGIKSKMQRWHATNGKSLRNRISFAPSPPPSIFFHSLTNSIPFHRLESTQKRRHDHKSTQFERPHNQQRTNQAQHNSIECPTASMRSLHPLHFRDVLDHKGAISPRSLLLRSSLNVFFVLDTLCQRENFI